MNITKEYLDHMSHIAVWSYIQRLQDVNREQLKTIMELRAREIAIEDDLRQLQFEVSTAPQKGGEIVGPILNEKPGYLRSLK